MTKDERVLTAAAKLFRKQGYAATTVRDIAQAARMLPGSLHYRYPTKDDVLIALMDRAIDRAIVVVEAAVSTVVDPIERLRVGMGTYLELLLEGDDALFVMLYDWRSLPPAARHGLERANAKYEAYWDVKLAEAYATGRARDDVDLELIRQFGFGALNWTATWYRKEAGRTPRQLADAFFAYMAHGLLDPKKRGHA